jgi:hypothetical protein
MIAEHEEEEEEEEEDEDEEEDMDTSGHGERAGRLRHTRSVEEGTARDSTDSGDSRSSSADRSSSASSPIHGPPPSSRGRTTNVRPLKTVRSSPNMLNEIFEEEGESEEDDDEDRLSPPTRLLQRNTVASPEVLRRYEQRKTGGAARSIVGKRVPGAPSASSSDASDTEDTATSCRAARRYHRRDSSDHSSDTDTGPSNITQVLGGSRSSKLAATPNAGQQDNNQENRHQQQQQQHQNRSNGKQNGVLGKRECQDEQPLSHKIHNMSLASLSSLTSSCSSRKYRVSEASSPPGSLSARTRTKHLAATTLMDALNTVTDKHKVIHVRSKDFSDLMDRFTPSKPPASSSSANTAAAQPKFRRRAKSNGKVDINRNGLISAPASDADASDLHRDLAQCNSVQTVTSTKCCSVI